MTTQPPFAIDLIATTDAAFDLADQLGMEGVMSALGVTIFNAPKSKMLVQALYASKAEAETALLSLDLSNDIERRIYQLPETDWVSETQAGLPPVHAGRFFLHGSHDTDKIVDGCTPILVEAGMAFGTGHHGTTAGCLEIFSRMLDDGTTPDRVLDLGCGAGVLAIAAAKTLPGADILATDIDPNAIIVTNQNTNENNVVELVEAHVVDGFESPVLKGRQFDLIFANILAGPLMGLADQITAATAPKGHVILSGIIDQKAQEVAACFTQAGLNVTPQPSLDGWTSLLAQKNV